MSDFSFVRGDDVVRTFTLYTSGTPQSLASATCVFHWSSDDRQADRATTGTHAMTIVGDGSAGQCKITLTQAESAAFSLGGFVGQVVATLADMTVQTFPLSAGGITFSVLDRV